jgi:hypothetical protein
MKSKIISTKKFLFFLLLGTLIMASSLSAETLLLTFGAGYLFRLILAIKKSMETG